jgi:hypothetical protein
MKNTTTLYIPTIANTSLHTIHGAARISPTPSELRELLRDEGTRHHHNNIMKGR